MRLEVTRAAPAGWDAYVIAHPLGTTYHLAAVAGMGQSAFGLATFYVTAYGQGESICGVLPLVEQSSVAFGRFLVSLPFVTYGGILASDQETWVALKIEAEALARSRGVDHVELRHSAPIDAGALPERLDKVSMILPLPQSEAALGKLLGSKLRSQIKRGDREDPQVIWGGVELIPEFYSVFARSMRDLGTPVYPPRFFQVAMAAMGSKAAVVVVRVRGRVEASAITVWHGSRIEVPWAAATPAAKRASLNMRLYWELLTAAIRSEAAAFDFGRSTTGSGTYKFKAQWGAKPMQLHWHYWLPAGKSIPHLNHSNTKFALATAVWKRLPLWCANTIGPIVSRSLP